MPLIPLSISELVYKVTILALKQRHLAGEAVAHVNREHVLLQQANAPLAAQVPPHLHRELQQVNAALWEVWEAIRACYQRGDFGDAFVALARRIDQLYDRRAAIKRATNLASGSGLAEQTNYANLPQAPSSP
jgi:hypothetical protein